MNPHQVTKDFEKALCEYAGAKYAVTTNSCTMALFLALKWHRKLELSKRNITIPEKTYCSVPMQIIQAGLGLKFETLKWSGAYQLKPYDIWDCARRFTSGMYVPGQFQCVSFHIGKILGIGQGGAILHNNGDADSWFRKARFDGRTEGVEPKDDKFIMGYHCYMSPDIAAHGLWKLQFLPKHNEDLPNSDYPDLSKQEIFKC